MKQTLQHIALRAARYYLMRGNLSQARKNIELYWQLRSIS